MSKKEMIQWAPGSKMQRFSRVMDEENYRLGIERGIRNSKAGIKKPCHVDCVKPGDLVLCQGQIYEAGEVDYEAKSVMLGIHKHGLNSVKKLPDYYADWYRMMIEDSKYDDFDFRVEIVEATLLPHPNADHLSIVYCFGLPVIVRTDDFIGQSKAAFIPAGSRITSSDPWYNWLGKEKNKVKVRKFRGLKSYGLLKPIPQVWQDMLTGRDMKAFMDIEHHSKRNKKK